MAVTANPDAHKISEHDLNNKAQGGSIFGRIGKYLHQGLAVAKQGLEHVKPEHLEQASNMLKKLTGDGSGVVVGAVVGGKYKYRRVV